MVGVMHCSTSTPHVHKKMVSTLITCRTTTKAETNQVVEMTTSTPHTSKVQTTGRKPHTITTVVCNDSVAWYHSYWCQYTLLMVARHPAEQALFVLRSHAHVGRQCADGAWRQ